MARKRKNYVERRYVGLLGNRLKEFSPFEEHGNEFEWRWCLHCEQAYMVREMRVFHDVPSPALREMGDEECDLVYCAYDDCDGTLIDSWKWDDDWRRENGYPDEPARGVVYPMYPSRADLVRLGVRQPK